MPPRSTLATLGSLLLAFGVSAPAGATSLSVLTYNTQGLPGGGGPARAALIAEQIEGYRTSNGNTVVHLQEAFAQAFYDAVTDSGTIGYANVSAKTTGGALGLGSGLVSMSDSTPTSFSAISFDDCFGSILVPTTDPMFGKGADCNADKGFTVARLEVEPGVFIDFYNTHTDAGGGADDTDSPLARQANLAQISSFMNTFSADVPVLLFGDTNSRNTAVEDEWGTFVAAAGLTEVWVDFARMGDVPPIGGSIKSGCPPPEGSAPTGMGTGGGPDCEIVDKILWRNGGRVELTPTAYAALENFVDMAGDPLSDHLPITTTFTIALVPEPATAFQLALGLAGLGAFGRRRAS